MDVKEKIENVYKDDLFLPTTGRKVYQIMSLCLCEFFGTFFLIFMGCLAWIIILEGYGFMVGPFPTLLNLALTWGLAYTGVYVCTAHISGLFLNPALAVSMVVLGEMSVYRMLMYWVSEILGALCALLLIMGTSGPLLKSNFCSVKPSDGLPLVSALMYELLGTYILSMLFAACHDARTRSSYDFSPVKLGVAFIGLTICFYKYTGCSLNPARSISTSIISNEYGDLWLYLVGQFVGAILGPLTYLLLFNETILEPGQGAAEE